MTQSIQELEREIEESRARLDLTIDRLQDRMSVSGIADDVMGQVRHRYRPGFDHALAVVRHNPVPVMLILAGLGLLAHRVSRERERARLLRDLRSRPPMPREDVAVAEVAVAVVDRDGNVEMVETDRVRVYEAPASTPVEPVGARPNLNARV